MTTLKNLTIRSKDLGTNLNMMMCFTPPVSGLYEDCFPVAWKTTRLGATGSSVMTVTYAANYAVSSMQKSSNGSSVTAGTYIPIGPGQQSTLENMSGGGGYQWTTPTNIGGTVIRAKNGTGSRVGIGCGFITGEGTNREEMNPAVMYDNVGNTLSVNAQFTPILKMYHSSHYQETDIVKSEIISDMIWERNLLSLGPSTTIWIRAQPDGSFTAEEASMNLGDDIPPSIDWSMGMSRLYRAKLAFESTDIILDSLKAMMTEMLKKGHQMKVVTKDGDKTARVELVLAPNTSCDQAEKDLMGGINITKFPLPIAIAERSGEIMQFSAGTMSIWRDINPAAMEWFTTKNPKDVENGNGYNGNGYNGNGYTSGMLTPMAPERYGGNTRIARKASSVSLVSNGF